MMNAAKPVDHTFIFDRMAGTYRDCGPATKLDRFLQHFTCGSVKVRPVKAKNNSSLGVAAQSEGYEKAK